MLLYGLNLCVYGANVTCVFLCVFDAEMRTIHASTTVAIPDKGSHLKNTKLTTLNYIYIPHTHSQCGCQKQAGYGEGSARETDKVLQTYEHRVP